MSRKNQIDLPNYAKLFTRKKQRSYLMRQRNNHFDYESLDTEKIYVDNIFLSSCQRGNAQDIQCVILRYERQGESDQLGRITHEFATAREVRLVTGECPPQSSSAYLSILYAFQDMGAHIKNAVLKLFSK
jgi:hypothetical protein